MDLLARGRPVQALDNMKPDELAQCATEAEVCPIDYHPYILALQDAEAKRRLVAVWLWLRAQHAAQADVAKTLAALPADLRLPGRDIKLDDDGRAIAIDLFHSRSQPDGRRVTSWSLPVPEWMAGAKPNLMPKQEH